MADLQCMLKGETRICEGGSREGREERGAREGGKSEGSVRRRMSMSEEGMIMKAEGEDDDEEK